MSKHGPLVGGMISIESLPELVISSGFWYLGTPYTKYPDGLEAAYLLAKDASDALHGAGVKHFSPIVTTHEAGQRAGIDLVDHEFWMQCDQPYCDRAFGLIVLGMEGWEESLGLTVERRMFLAARKPVVFLNPSVILAAE